MFAYSHPYLMDLEHDLTQLERARLIHLVDEEELAYIFKHALVQEATYRTLLARSRRQLHLRLARIYERQYAGQLDDFAILVAHHYAEAGENDQAIPYLLRAGERATRVSAYAEAIKAYEHALNLVPEKAQADRADLFVRLGEVHFRHSEYDAAKENFRAGLSLAQETGAEKTAAIALTGLARISGQQGEHKEAQHFGEEALRRAREANDPASTARALRQLGIGSNYQGNNEQAAQYLRDSLAIYHELGDLEGIASCLNSLGVVATDERDYDAAWSDFQEALDISRKLGDRYSICIRLTNLAAIDAERGNGAAAVQYLREALAIAKDIGDREGAAHIFLNLGGVAVKQHDLATALQHYREALAETRATGSFALALYIMAAVAQVQVERGRFEQAAELLSLAFEHPAGTADIKADFESVHDKLRAALPAGLLEAAMERGRTRNLEVVVKEILDDKGSAQ